MRKIESGVFGVGDFGIATYGEPYPYNITLSIPTGYVINNQIVGRIINSSSGYLINTQITGEIIDISLTGKLIDNKIIGKIIK